MRGLQIMSLLAAWTTFAVVLQVAGGGTAAAPDSAKRASPPPINVGLVQEQPKDKPPAARAEPVPASAKGAGRASEGVAIQIDATYDDPTSTVRWMLSAGGWMAVAVDRNHQPVGRVLQDGKVVPPGVVTSGVPRLATAEVISILPQGLPPGATAVWLVWPRCGCAGPQYGATGLPSPSRALRARRVFCLRLRLRQAAAALRSSVALYGARHARPQWLYASRGSATADYAPSLRSPWRAAPVGPRWKGACARTATSTTPGSATR